MQVYRNDPFIQRRAKIGRYANLGGMGILLFGLIINLSMRTDGLLLSMLAQAALALLAGRQRDENPVYQLFALLTSPPRRLLAFCLPARTPVWLVNGLTGLALLLLWLGLAFFRQIA